MRKLYQTEWHGIPFESFVKISSSKLADASFYSAFYDAFFKKYQKLNELDPSWIELKLQTKEFLKQHSKLKKDSNILSVGCGLGIIEKALIEDGYSNLSITEVSTEPLRWLLPHIPSNNVYIGSFPNCIPANKLYDFIYLSSVEYFFDQDQLIDFLKAVADHLSTGGICLMISWSFESMKPLQTAVVNMKDLVKFVLDKIGIRNLGQFWGYIRNREDFYHVMINAGFKQVNDGFLEKNTRWDTYWIEGIRGLIQQSQ